LIVLSFSVIGFTQPHPKERVIELRVDEFILKIMGPYLFPITYNN
jgi:hypothetical protein